MIQYRSTQPAQWDSTNILLGKLLQAFGGSPDAADSENEILAKILRLANVAAGSSVPGVKIYRALLTQTGTAAPQATVLENTIGDIVWVRLDAGSYEAQLTGAFEREKTFLMINSVHAADNLDIAAISHNTTDAITVITGQVGTPGPPGVQSDEVLNVTPVEIIVYP